MSSTTTSELNEFETRLLQKALEQLPRERAWSKQIELAKATKRDYTELGMFCDLAVPDSARATDMTRRGLETICLRHPTLSTGAYAVVWVDQGRFIGYELCVWNSTERFPRYFDFDIDG